MKTTIAALADIHCNTSALAAELYDIREAGLDLYYKHSDTLYCPLDHAGTYTELMTSCIATITILDNCDKKLL